MSHLCYACAGTRANRVAQLSSSLNFKKTLTRRFEKNRKYINLYAHIYHRAFIENVNFASYNLAFVMHFSNIFTADLNELVRVIDCARVSLSYVNTLRRPTAFHTKTRAVVVVGPEPEIARRECVA